jgi:hypothetical protein
MVWRAYLPVGDPDEIADRLLGATCLGGMVKGDSDRM